MRNQVIHSALDLGRRYGFDEKRAKRVARHADELFALLDDEHRLSPRCELILHVAALLKDIGLYVSNRGHHKHSMYLIRNSDLFGLGDRDLLLTALVARYHRKALPRPTHEGYITLDRKGRTEVAKMAAMLRLASALERFHADRGCRTTCSLEDGRLVVQATGAGDLTMERYNLVAKSEMFEQFFGCKVIVRLAKRG
jgi:exopolyphosphatase/guanosine-5'-triphosphate,3'-diphosphate pyrophosphatase